MFTDLNFKCSVQVVFRRMTQHVVDWEFLITWKVALLTSVSVKYQQRFGAFKEKHAKYQIR